MAVAPAFDEEEPDDELDDEDESDEPEEPLELDESVDLSEDLESDFGSAEEPPDTPEPERLSVR